MAQPAAAETSCKSSWFGICTSHYTPAEQAEIEAGEGLKAFLRDDPVLAARELERRLRQKVRYYNGTLVIENPILHNISTYPANLGWSIECSDSWIYINFGDTSESGNGVSVDLSGGIGADARGCRDISTLLGAAVQRLTRGSPAASDPPPGYHLDTVDAPIAKEDIGRANPALQWTSGPFDGRWSATVGPQGGCRFTSILILDVVGPSIVGNATNSGGVFPVSGRVNEAGQGSFKIGGFVGTIRFSGTTF